MTEGTHAIKKSTRKAPEDHGLVGAVIEMVLASFRGWFNAAIASIERSVTEAMVRIARQIFILFLALLGLAFLLFGFSKMLSYFFQVPGIGESIVGVFMLAMAFILALFTRDGK